MPLDFSDLVYHPAYDMFARRVIVTPYASQPNTEAYTNRGIFNTVAIDVVGIDGSVISEQRTILDVRNREYSVVPKQKDHIEIPSDGTLEAIGTFEVADVKDNGGGETTLTLYRVVPDKPA